MKPEGPIARRGDYVVREIPFAEAAAFIIANHYARGCSHTAVFSHGLLRGGQLVGAALWLPPTKPCARTVHADWRRVLSLSRLAVLDSEPRNAESLFVGRALRFVRASRRWAAVVTFADDSQGHTGTIYRATNWIRLGKTKPTQRWLDSTGRQVAILSTRTRTVAEMKKMGCRMVGKFAKHKFAIAFEGELIHAAHAAGEAAEIR